MISITPDAIDVPDDGPDLRQRAIDARVKLRREREQRSSLSQSPPRQDLREQSPQQAGQVDDDELSQRAQSVPIKGDPDEDDVFVRPHDEEDWQYRKNLVGYDDDDEDSDEDELQDD